MKGRVVLNCERKSVSPQGSNLASDNTLDAKERGALYITWGIRFERVFYGLRNRIHRIAVEKQPANIDRTAVYP